MRYFNLSSMPPRLKRTLRTILSSRGPRADAARMLLRLVAVNARLTTEMEELKRSRNSHSVWKLHADSLVVLIDLAKRLAESRGPTRISGWAASGNPEEQRTAPQFSR